MNLKINKLSSHNKLLAKNVIGSFLVKGVGMIVSFATMPLYLNFFEDAKILGLWFTILSVLNWILSFDLGIGNGLRNNLTQALAQKDDAKCRELISSSYAMLGTITLFVIFSLLTIFPLLDLNSFFNLPQSAISESALKSCIKITLVGIVLSFFLRLANSQLYALQLAAVNNLNHMVTNILLIGFLFVIKPDINQEVNLLNIGIAYAIITNLPLVVITILIFTKSQLKDSKPSLRYVSKESAKQVFSLGLTFLVLQILYMIITVTNEWFISYFFDAKYCVDYQVYYRIFSLIGTLFLLFLSPMWSAITKAFAEKRYSWILKLQKVLYSIAIGLSLVQLIMIPFLQPIVDLWLGDKSIVIDNATVSIFILYSIITIWISVQSTLAAGLGTLKVQAYGYTLAVILKILGIIVLSKFIDNWNIVILTTSLALLPYCVIQPILLNKKLKSL